MVRATRNDDHILIDWLRRRDAGEKPSDIARDFGVSTQRVSTATNKVADADAGEDSNAYIWRVK